jgi:hypothetical protein
VCQIRPAHSPTLSISLLLLPEHLLLLGVPLLLLHPPRGPSLSSARLTTTPSTRSVISRPSIVSKAPTTSTIHLRITLLLPLALPAFLLHSLPPHSHLSIPGLPKMRQLLRSLLEMQLSLSILHPQPSLLTPSSGVQILGPLHT